MERMVKIAADRDPRVRLQASIAAPKLAVGQSASEENVKQQIRVLRSSSNDPLLPRVAWQNLKPHLLEQQTLVLDSLLQGVDQSEDLLREMAPRIASVLVAQVKPAMQDDLSKTAVNSVLLLAAGLSEKHPNLSASVLETLLVKSRTGEIKGDALSPVFQKWLASNNQKASFGTLVNAPIGSLSLLQKAILAIRLVCADSSAIDMARQIVLEPKMDGGFRKQMLQAVVQVQPKIASEALHQLLGDLVAERPIDGGYRDAALDAGIALAGAADTEQLVASLPKLKIAVQAAIGERMCRRSDTAQSLLNQIIDGKLRKELISPNRVRLLAADSNEATQKLVAKIWGKVNVESTQEREEVVTRMANKLRWDARGDAEKGLVVYDRICGQCHLMNGRGHEVGPNITTNGRGSYEQLLVSVFNPSLVIGDAYKSVTLRTVDGTVVTGLLVEKTDKRTVIKVQGGKEETIPSEDIEDFKQDKKSLMPEGIENQMTPQELADLFALLTLEGPPSARENAKISGTPENLHSKQRP
jgi:putative heme-binding domain-containing protein